MRCRACVCARLASCQPAGKRVSESWLCVVDAREQQVINSGSGSNQAAAEHQARRKTLTRHTPHRQMLVGFLGGRLVGELCLSDRLCRRQPLAQAEAAGVDAQGADSAAACTPYATVTLYRRAAKQAQSHKVTPCAHRMLSSRAHALPASLSLTDARVSSMGRQNICWTQTHASLSDAQS